MHRILMFAAVVLVGFTVVLGTTASATEKAYTEGTVWTLTFVKTQYGMTDDYLTSLQANYKKLMDEAQKQGLVISYKILSSMPADKNDWDILLMVECKNMASLDGLNDKLDAIGLKVVGTEDEQKNLTVKRASLREILGSKLCRELILK